VEILLEIWLMYAVPAAVLPLPVVILGRHRVHWRSWELLALVLPFCVWVGVCIPLGRSGRKNWGNTLEPLYFSFAVPIAAPLPVSIGKARAESLFALGLLVAECLVAAVVGLFTPKLGGLA
jgi:hypothetical protein